MGICDVDLEDMEFNETMKHARKNSELHMDLSMPCELRRTSGKSSLKAPEDPHEKTRDEQWRGHEDHIAEQRVQFYESKKSCALTDSFAPGKKRPDAKAAADKEWEKLKSVLAWQESKVRSKQEVIEKAQKEGRTNSFCNAH